jgi:hypothetical protein
MQIKLFWIGNPILKRDSQKQPSNLINLVMLIACAGLLLIARNGFAEPLDLDWNNPWKPTDPLPKFITADFVNVSNLEKISKFRSGAGHNYSDEYEAPDRSMKHYFVPLPQYRETQGTDHSLRVYSPVAGTVVKIKDDIWNTTLGLGSHQLHIIPDGYNMFEVRLFHINNLDTIVVGSHVSAGQWIGYADMRESYTNDLAVDCIYGATPSYPNPQRPEGFPNDRGIKDVSAFEVMVDSLFTQYQARGIANRSELAFTKEYRDANPVTDWQHLHPEDWVTLLEAPSLFYAFLPLIVKDE